MKNLSVVLFIIISVLTACNNLITSEKVNYGGMLIIYGDSTQTTSIELLETKFRTTSKGEMYEQIKPLEPGYYTLIINGKKTVRVNKIRVVKDSLSIVPISYFEQGNKETRWGEKKHWYIEKNTNQLNGLPGLIFTKTLKDGTTVVDTSFYPPLQKKIKMCDNLPTTNLSGKVSLEYPPCKNCTVWLARWWYADTDKDDFYHFKNVLPGIYPLGGYGGSSADQAYTPYPKEVNLTKDTTYTINLYLMYDSIMRMLE